MGGNARDLLRRRGMYRRSSLPQRYGPGFAGIVPPDTLHSVTALSSGKVIVVDYPRREGFAQQMTEPHY